MQANSALGQDRSFLTGSPVLVHLRRDILVSDKAFRTELAQSAMGSFRVVMLPPIFLTRAKNRRPPPD